MEQIDLQYITHSNLNLLGIRDLRKLAFAFGVYGFTLYNKSELITHIIDVVFGREAPKIEAGKGRPTSINRNRTSIINDSLSKIKALQAVQVFDFSDALQQVASFSEPYDSNQNDEIDVSGYIENYNNSFFVRNNDSTTWTTPCLIPIELAKLLNLRSGQKISGRAILHVTGHYVLTSVKDNTEFETNFDELKIAKANQKLVLNSPAFKEINNYYPLEKGARTLFVGPQKVIQKWKDEVISCINSKNLVIISTLTPPEAIIKYNDKYENTFLASFGEDHQTQKRIFALGFEKAKRIAEVEGEAVVVILSLNSAIKAFDYGSVISAATNKAFFEAELADLRNYCMAAHNTKNNISISLISFAECDNEIQNAMIEQLSEIFTTKIVAENKESQTFPLNKSKSFSSNL